MTHDRAVPESGDTAIRILAVVVAYRSSAILGRCLDALALDPVVTEVVVVDNSSEPAAAQAVLQLHAHDDRFTYLDPDENLGFARGCNRGAAVARPGWTHVVFVNPDVRLTAPLTPLAQQLDDGAAVAAGLLVSPGHPHSVNARPIATLRREFAKAVVGTRAYRMAPPASDGNARKVEQVDGALLAMGSTTFRALGGFDERFELYYEDVDLCARAAAHGAILLLPAPWGVHEGGASFAAASANAYRLGRVSRVRYLRKHSGSGVAVGLAIAGIAVTEWVTRTLSRQGEGMRTRSAALRLQLRELARPGSVRLLAR